MEDIKYNLKLHYKHKHSKKRAFKALKTIESYRGKTNPKLIKLSNEYSKDIFGKKVYAPWLIVYSALQNEFKEGWIPDNYYSQEVVPRLKGNYGKMADKSFITPLLFSKIKTLDLGYLINNKFCSLDNEILNPDDFKNHIFKNDNKLVYKSDNSQSGKGITILDKNNFDSFNFLSKNYTEGVFQTYIQQHPFFSEFTDHSVATIRITTTSDETGHISVRAAYLRLGRNKDTHVMTNSAVSVPININTGELFDTGYIKWLEIDSHPDRKVPFKNKKIPNFDKCLNSAIQMHSEIPFMGCIGWDIIVDKFEEVKLIEWNGKNNDIKLSEATKGPCFKGLNWENLYKKEKSIPSNF